MADLKTLKDIKFIYPIAGARVSRLQIVKYCLKKEAIKWAKELKKCSKEDGSCKHDNDVHYVFSDNPEDTLSQNECIAVKDWIRHFFNISEEEDLK